MASGGVSALWIRNISALCLVVISLCAITREFSPAGWLSSVAGGCMVLFLALQWRHTHNAFKFFVVLAPSLGLFLWLTHQVTWAELAAAIDRSAFFTFFLTSLSVLREASNTSSLVRRSGAILVRQPPGRRYLLMTIGAHLFSIMLNLGALNVLGTMVKRAIPSGETDEERRIATIRSRRMLTAVLRGFSAIMIWSPTSVTMLLVMSSMSNMTWEQYAPLGLLLASLFILWGAILDRLSYPQRKVAPDSNRQLRQLIPLVLLVALIPTSAFVVAELTGIRLFSALLMCVPLIGVIWISFQYKRVKPSMNAALLVRRITHSFPATFTGQRNEVALFASSGFIGVILIPLVDPVWVNDWMQQVNIGDAWLMIMISLTILLFSMLAINPIMTVTLILGVLQELPGFTVPSVIQVVVIVVTWAVYSSMSPFNAALRFISNFSSVSPMRFGWVWNGAFNLTILLALYAVLLIYL